MSSPLHCRTAQQRVGHCTWMSSGLARFQTCTWKQASKDSRRGVSPGGIDGTAREHGCRTLQVGKLPWIPQHSSARRHTAVAPSAVRLGAQQAWCSDPHPQAWQRHYQPGSTRTGRHVRHVTHARCVSATEDTYHGSAWELICSAGSWRAIEAGLHPHHSHTVTQSCLGSRSMHT